MKIRIIKVDDQISSLVIDRADESDDYVSELDILEYPGEGYVDSEGRPCSYHRQEELPVVFFAGREELNLTRSSDN